MMRHCTKVMLFVAVCFAGTWCAAASAADAPQGELLSGALSERIVSESQDWGEMGTDTSAAALGKHP